MASRPKARKTKAKPTVASVRTARSRSVVRSFLQTLNDQGVKNGIERFASEIEVPASQLRSFRDGNNRSLSNGLTTSIAKILGSDTAFTGYSNDPDQEPTIVQRLASAGITDASESGRIERYRLYRLITKTRPEGASAVQAWADLGVVGGTAEMKREPFVPEYEGTDAGVRNALRDVGSLVNRQLMPQNVKLMAFHGMCLNGDQWAEVGLSRASGRYDIGQLAPRDARTMFVNRRDDGSTDPSIPYFQQIGGSVGGGGVRVDFKPWQIVRFANLVGWGDIYGTSIFESVLRSYMQIEAMECAMSIRRLTRAALRYLRILDVGHVQPDDIFDAVDTQKRKNKKVRTVDINGRKGLMNISLPPEEDLWIGKRDKDSPADVRVLEGDGNIGQIQDVASVFLPKWFAGLGPPKAHLGWEADTTRSVISDLHIVFARKVRAMQMKFLAALNHLYWIGLILRGYDPRTIEYSIVPPTMGTRDEVMRAQVMQAYGRTVNYLATAFAQSGQMPSIKWFLREIVGMPEESLQDDALELVDVLQVGKTAGADDPKPGSEESIEMANAALAVEEIRREVGVLRHLVNERAIAKKAEGAIGMKTTEFNQINLTPVLPAGGFDALIESMGVRYLRRVS